MARWTQRTYYACLNTFFVFCVEQGYAERNPCGKVKRPEKPRKKINYVTPKQLEKLCNAIEDEAERTVYVSPEAEAILQGIAAKRGTAVDPSLLHFLNSMCLDPLAEMRAISSG